MRLFRKKPVMVEAVQLTEPNAWDTAAWAGGAEVVCDIAIPLGINIRTLEGTMSAAIGDWIIRGVKGEFYPCKPDIFAATYEPAD